MKFSQIIIALTLGMLAFAGVYMSEQSRQQNIKKLQNPFEQTNSLPESLELTASDGTETIFDKNRELWQFYPGSQGAFTGGTRTITDGPAFVSFSFITEQDFAKAQAYQSDSFDIDKFTPGVGQLSVHDFGITAPGASLFVERDSEGKSTKVYAYDHAVDIWFAGSSKAFVLPAGNYVTIKDVVTDRLGKLYYTKLKKDLRLRPIDNKVPEIVAEAIEIKNEKLENIKNFAESLPNTWYWFDPNSFMGDVVEAVRYMQRDYALGISQELRQKFFFQRYLASFLSAHHGYLNNAPKVEIQSKIRTFTNVLNSSQWRQFLVRYPEWEANWDFLGQNQKVWLHHSFQDDLEYVFAPIWFSAGRGESLEDIEDSFFEVEEMAHNRFIGKARQGLVNLSQSLVTLTIEPAQAPRITRMRRLLDNLLDRESTLQNEEIFVLLQQLIELEIGLYSSSNPAREEIVLENAQNVLHFLEIFITDRTAGKINQTLVNTYSLLEIDKIETRLGRAIFNQTEKETIQLVQFARSENLTETELNEIEATKSLQELIDERFAELEENKTQEAEAVYYNEQKIDSKGEFVDLLEQSSVLTEGMDIETQGSDASPSYSFRGAYYGRFPINGVFSVSRQEFSFIKLQNVQEKFVDPRYLSSILRRMEKDYLESSTPVDVVGDSRPSQNTPLAILQRKLVRETFEQEGLRVERDNVEIVDTSYNEFEVTDALIDKEYRVHFTYYQKEEYVTNLVVEYVRNRFEFGDQVIPRSDIKGFIKEAVIERFKTFNES